MKARIHDVGLIDEETLRRLGVEASPVVRQPADLRTRLEEGLVARALADGAGPRDIHRALSSARAVANAIVPEEEDVDDEELARAMGLEWPQE